MTPDTRVELIVPRGLDGDGAVRLFVDTLVQHPTIATAVIFQPGQPILLELGRLTADLSQVTYTKGTP